MDVVRGRARARLAWKNVLLATGIAALVLAGAWGTTMLLHPGERLPAVERSTIVTDSVRFGTLERIVRAPGTFVSEHVTIVAAPHDAIVSQVVVKPGAQVAAGSVIAVLGSPDLDAQIADLRAQIVAAQAQVVSARQEARADSVDSHEAALYAAAEREAAEMQAKSDAALHAQGLIGDVQYRVAEIKAEELRGKAAAERSKVAVIEANSAAKIALAEAKVQQLNAALAARLAERNSLHVASSTSGIVQSVSVENGQRLAAGAEVARVAAEHDLKAVLLVPEADAHNVTVGLSASVDAGNGLIRGRVVRIDPAAQNGSVAVDVGFDGRTPRSARPDLHVDGTIQIDRIRNTLSVSRPANAGDNAEADLYRIAGDRAIRTPVRLGRGSLDRIQVLSGLRAGDTVVISDTSSYNNFPMVQLR